MAKGKEHPMSLEGYRSLYDTLYAPLCLFASKYIRDMDTSKDIVQEVFIKIWEKKPAFRNHNAVKSYFYNAVKNRSLDYLKNKQLKVLREATPLDPEVMQTETYYLSQITTVETYAELYKAMETLPKKTAKVIQLTLNDYTTNEIAEELNVTPSTVRTQKTMAYQKLRKILGDANLFFFL